MLFGSEFFEIEILNGIRSGVECSAVDWLMKGASFIGNGGAVWIAVAVIMMLSKKYRKGGLMMAVGLLLGLLIGNLMLKNLVARPRPCWIFEDIRMLVEMPKDYSFPSGHTLASFVSAFVLMNVNRKFGIVAMIVAAIMAFSRMYLFVHYPTDIAGGILLAAIIAFVVVKVFKKIEQKKLLGKNK